MAITPLDIANMALGVLDEAPIDSLDQDVKPARLLNLHFDLTREAELTKHAWVFAILAAAVAGSDTGSGAGTLNFAYELPVDCLRPLPLTDNGEPDGVPIAWRQEAGLIYCDRSGPRLIRYVANLTDPNDWDALFTEVLVAALAINRRTRTRASGDHGQHPPSWPENHRRRASRGWRPRAGQGPVRPDAERDLHGERRRMVSRRRCPHRPDLAEGNDGPHPGRDSQCRPGV
ncbi:hypothetical protein [Mesorhizobium sp.]|uniref:hypothetical protein n=1 Tax=Mesorhizobium sp. TaxID=1871066 RepID=UPI00257A47AA|nr:hypothetical protein [Mesorhizobium sp.]